MTAISLTRPFRSARRRARRDTQASHVVLRVDYTAGNGQRWWSIGGGKTEAHALRSAREALPLGRSWEVAAIRTLYGQ
jgi:hypothetical protein